MQFVLQSVHYVQLQAAHQNLLMSVPSTVYPIEKVHRHTITD